MNPEIWSVKQSQEKTFHSTTDDVVACWRCFELVGLTTGQMDPQNLSHLVNAKHPFLGSVYLIWLVVLNMFIFQNIWDNPSLTSLFFKMVKTTNQWCLSHSHIIWTVTEFPEPPALKSGAVSVSVSARFEHPSIVYVWCDPWRFPKSWATPVIESKRWGFSHGNPTHPASLDYWGIPIGNHHAAWWFLDFLGSAKSGLKIGHICSSNRLTPSYSPIKFMDTCGWLPSSSPLK